MRFALFSATVLATSTLALSTASAATLMERYFTALHLDEVFEILRDEGISAGQKMTEDGQISASPAWTGRLRQIYDVEKMETAFRQALEASSGFERSWTALAFFETNLGKRIARLELDARKALAAEGLEDEMLSVSEELKDDDADRYAQYEQFIEVNSLIDSNVSGALNSNLSFYQGMASNPAFAQGMTEDFMLTAVWSQEGEIREDMRDWTISFSTLAYESLSDDEMQSYIDVSATPAGQDLNAALFAGFDRIFARQSYELGRATAEFSVGDDT